MGKDNAMRQAINDHRDWEAIWRHLNRMQQAIMAHPITKREFFAEDADERLEYYEWMQKQCGEYACWM